MPIPPPNVYKPGTTVVLSCLAFAEGEPIDPFLLACTVKLPDGTILTPNVQRDNQGIYEAHILIPFGIVLDPVSDYSQALVRWQATGSASPDGFRVVEYSFLIEPLDF